MSTAVTEILELSVSERLQIVEDIWDSIASEASDLPLSEELRAELDRRLEEFEDNPGEGISLAGTQRPAANIAMKYHLIIRRKAEADIEASYNWYEDQSGGLGNEFLRTLDAALVSIERSPLTYPIIYKDIRRTVVRRFPHAFFFIVRDDRIVITACVHHKRDRKVWQFRK